MPRPIKWHGLSERDKRQCGEDCDLYTKRPSGSWDVIHGVYGWTILSPTYWKTLRDEYRIVVGHVNREEARLRAEELIHQDEGRH